MNLVPGQGCYHCGTQAIELIKSQDPKDNGEWFWFISDVEYGDNPEMYVALHCPRCGIKLSVPEQAAAA